MLSLHVCEWNVPYAYAYTLFRHYFNVGARVRYFVPSFFCLLFYWARICSVFHTKFCLSRIFGRMKLCWPTMPLFPSLPTRHRVLIASFMLPCACTRVHFLCTWFSFPPPPRSTPVMSPGSCLFMCTSPFWRIPIVSDVIFLSSSLVIIHYSFIFT